MKIKNIIVDIDKIKVVVLSLMISCISLFAFQVSTQGVWFLFSLKILYVLINLGIIFVFVSLFYSITDKFWLSEMICSVIVTVYSIVNVYVVEFHGTPLTIPEFANTKTALNVLHGYSLLEWKPLCFVAIISVLFLINVVLIRILKKHEVPKRKKSKVNRLFRIGLSLFIGFLYIGGILQSDYLVKPLSGCWHFKQTAGLYGYPFYFLTSGLEYEIEEPKGYSEENLEKIQVEQYLPTEELQSQKPDIFLILNESFYDISLVLDLETDVNYMGEFFDMDNSISGYAIVPQIGGGTNKSEYELLTSNSTCLFPEITPFRTLNVSESASIVSNLKELGYYTIGMHPAEAPNYNRQTAYPLLGFDEIHFDDDFKNKKYYGNRKLLSDACSYEYMIQWYENALQQNDSIFSYMITIQNHGAWDRNPADEDTVHVQNYSNTSYEDKLNEYLSCIDLSVDALNNLIEYFKNSERPVILCMVGDHAPSFTDNIADDDS